MKVELELPNARWREGDIVKVRAKETRILRIVSRRVGGRFDVVGDSRELVVDRDYYTAVDQPGSFCMPCTVAVYYRDELDRDGEPWQLDCEPVEPITDSDEYRRRRDEWEARKEQ